MEQQQPKAEKRQSKKGRATYESDDDAQIAMRLARLRRDVLEQQDDVEEETVVDDPEHTDDALERLRTFRESLGIPESHHHRQHSTPKSKSMSKRRYNSGLGRKDFETPTEVSEAQLLFRLQRLRQSLTSPERSRATKTQRVPKKKKMMEYFTSIAPAPTTNIQGGELFSAAPENPPDTGMLPMQAVTSGLAPELQQHWAMDLNNVMHMGFAIEGGQVDQFVGHGHLHQYAQ